MGTYERRRDGDQYYNPSCAEKGHLYILYEAHSLSVNTFEQEPRSAKLGLKTDLKAHYPIYVAQLRGDDVKHV